MWTAGSHPHLCTSVPPWLLWLQTLLFLIALVFPFLLAWCPPGCLHPSHSDSYNLVPDHPRINSPSPKPPPKLQPPLTACWHLRLPVPQAPNHIQNTTAPPKSPPPPKAFLSSDPVTISTPSKRLNHPCSSLPLASTFNQQSSTASFNYLVFL